MLKYIIFITFSTLLYGCNKAPSERITDCTKSQCITLENQKASITIETKSILVEQLYTFHISSSEPISQIYIESINMDMGKIPLHIDEQPNSKHKYKYKGQFMLGICSEPKMVWQFVIHYQNETREKIIFESSWKQN